MAGAIKSEEWRLYFRHNVSLVFVLALLWCWVTVVQLGSRNITIKSTSPCDYHLFHSLTYLCIHTFSAHRSISQYQTHLDNLIIVNSIMLSSLLLCTLSLALPTLTAPTLPLSKRLPENTPWHLSDLELGPSAFSFHFDDTNAGMSNRSPPCPPHLTTPDKQIPLFSNRKRIK